MFYRLDLILKTNLILAKLINNISFLYNKAKDLF